MDDSSPVPLSPPAVVPAPAAPDRWISKTILFLVVTELVILVLDVIFNYLAVVDDDRIQELFNVARELSIGNWFSSIQEAGVGLVLWLIHLEVKNEPGARWRALGWAVLGVLFFYIGLDDGTQMHERVSSAIGDYFALTSNTGTDHAGPMGWFGIILDHFPSYEWQVVFGPVFAAFGIFMIFFLWRHMERQLALVVYLGLFLYGIAQGQDFIEGLETPYDWLTEKFGTQPYTVPHFMKMGEEYLEMIGTTVVLWPVLKHYARLTRRSG